jgi:hypothetical protein
MKNNWYIFIFLCVIHSFGAWGWPHVIHGQMDSTDASSSWSDEQWREVSQSLDWGEKEEEEEEKDQEKQSKKSETEEKRPPSLSFFSGDIGKILAYCCLGLLVLAVVWIIYKGRRGIKDAAVEVSLDEIQKDEEHIEITETDLDKLLRLAIADANFRLAIRIYFLDALKTLNHQKYIQWERSKTNGAYQRELIEQKFSPQFQSILLIYEIVWYGERGLNESEFNQLSPLFVSFKKIIIESAT